MRASTATDCGADKCTKRPSRQTKTPTEGRDQGCTTVEEHVRAARCHRLRRSAQLDMAALPSRWLQLTDIRQLIISTAPPPITTTLAATLVAYRTYNAAEEPLLDSRMLNGVLIMVLVTSILGPVLTQRFAPRMLEERPNTQSVAGARA
jgi:hypothetical protein